MRGEHGGAGGGADAAGREHVGVFDGFHQELEDGHVSHGPRGEPQAQRQQRDEALHEDEGWSGETTKGQEAQ